MKHLSNLIALIICLGVTTVKSQPSADDKEKEIKKTIEKFVQAGELRKVSEYTAILHQDFRVIANRYPTPNKIAIIPLEQYTSMISKKIIGGTKYQIKYKNINIQEHSATVLTHLKSDKNQQYITFLLIQDQGDKWKIITNMAVLENNE